MNSETELTEGREARGVASAMRKWVTALPEHGVPDPGDFRAWLFKAGTADVLRKCIGRTGRKNKNTIAATGEEMTSEDVAKYLTSVILREARGEHWETYSVTTRSGGDQMIIRATGRTKRNRLGIRRLD